MNGVVPYDDECFVIAPIGEERGAVRRRSDRVLKLLIEPVAQELGLTALRAERETKQGRIDDHVIEHLAYARAAVADLTGRNANVFYELGIRHALKLPVVLIVEKGEDVPADLAPQRVIRVQAMRDQSLRSARASLRAQLARSLKAHDEGATGAEIFKTLEFDCDGLRPPAPKPSLLGRARAARLGPELEGVFRSAAARLERSNSSETFVAYSPVTNLLVGLDETDKDLLALWRCDYDSHFFDQDVAGPEVADYLSYLEGKPEMRQRRIMTYRAPKPPRDGETLERFKRIHAKGSFFGARAVQLTRNLGPMSFGCTLSPAHHCAVIPIADPKRFEHCDPGSDDIAAILQAQPAYSRRSGPMRAIVTFQRPYVSMLIKEFNSVFSRDDLVDLGEDGAAP